MTTVSVIIPNYNHAPYLRQRIDSVLSQTYNDYEVILLDDCSSDASRDIMASYTHHPKVSQIVYNEKNSGSTFRQWEKGLKLAKGEWIWIAESDDFCAPNFLETLLSEVIPATCGLRYCVSLPVDEASQVILQYKPYDLKAGVWEGHGYLGQHLIDNNCIPNASAVIVRKELLEEVLTKDITELRMVGDWVTWSVMALKTDIYYSGNATKNYHRYHNATVRGSQSKKSSYYKEHATYRRMMHHYISNTLKGLSAASLLKKNKALLHYERGMYGCELLRNKEYFLSLPLILEASILPKPNLYFIKSAVYWLRRIKKTEDSGSAK